MTTADLGISTANVAENMLPGGWRYTTCPKCALQYSTPATSTMQACIRCHFCWDDADLGISTPAATKYLIDGGVVVIVRDGRVISHTVPDSDRFTRAALSRCARLRFRRADAQRTHALLLQKLCSDLMRDPQREPPEHLAGDAADVLAAMAMDRMRHQQVSDQVRSFAATL